MNNTGSLENMVAYCSSPYGFNGFTHNERVTWNFIVKEKDFNKYGWIRLTSSGKTISVYGGNSFFMVSHLEYQRKDGKKMFSF